MNSKLSKSDFILLAIYFSIALCVRAYDYYLDKNTLLEHLVDHTAYLIVSLTFVLLCFYWLIPKFIVSKKYIQFIIITLLLMAVLGGLRRTIGHWSETFELYKLSDISFNLFLASISEIAQSSGMPLGLLLTKKFYEGKNELLKIKEQQKESELKLLRSQFDPHFLFNNLNTLDSLIDSDSKKAKEYINRLSLIYRYLIQTKDAEVMELADELEFAEHYIFLIDTRFGSDYEFSIDKNGTIRDKFIPTGALQTVLENVVKHNKIQKGLCVKTRIEIYDDNVTVSNLKSILNKNKDSLGTGLKNLKTRYSLLSENTLHIEETEDHYKISLPLLKLSNDL
jgi:sensor histidine kinase YesM